MSRSDRIHSIASEIGALALQGSVSNKHDLERLVATAVSEFDRIDVVINNSGHPAGGKITSISDEHWMDVFQMYFLSVVRMARLVTPIMVKQRGGSIVNISGHDATEPDPRFPVASTIRASMGAFRKLYAREYGPLGIRMNCLMPSVVLDSGENVIPEDVRKQIPTGRAATHQEIAKVALFLASDKASYVTGHGLRVDGGASRAF
ncbi:MAG: SDR family oxidoreductase [Candidatus Acidiferrales bacterium]